ncbi:MAG: S-layer homology domain-containing protein [Syntrophomonadaceae bacterium]|jgi:hypothetical protein|nr:S-layer homology domain-containing protein [Syntrophomonadaceae bacterium]
MKTLIKIFLSAFLIVVMACETSWFPLGNSNTVKIMEQTAYTQEDIPSLKLSYNSELGLEIKANNDLITIFVPSEQIYTSIMLILRDSNDNEVYKKVSKRKWQGEHLVAEFSIDYLTDGLYYLGIYTNNGESNTYSSVVYKHDIPLNRSAGKWSFNIAPTFAINSNIFHSKRTDSNALAFYTLPSANIQSKAPEIYALAEQIAGGLNDPYEKAVAIHDWVCNNIWYDFDSFSNLSSDTDTSALNTLKTGRSVCEGYAALTAALLRAQGIPAKLIHGYALGITGGSVWTDNVLSGNEINHTWNEAFLNNRWVIIDTTWDSANAFENGVIIDSNGLRNRRYFDASLEAFSIDHLIQDYSEENIPDGGTLDILAGGGASPWAEASIQQAYTEGLIPDNLTSSLQNRITREEFCTLAINFISLLTGKSIEDLKNELIEDGFSLNPDRFEDTKSESVLLANIYGITEGISNRRFNPNGFITREQAAVMLHRLGELFGTTASDAHNQTFTDVSSISYWAVEAVAYITACLDPVDKVYVMSGTSENIFDPQGFYTREQSVVTMLRLCHFIKFSS